MFFYKVLSKRDGLNSVCEVCKLGYYNEKREQKVEHQNFYAKRYRAKINLYEKNKRKTNLISKLDFNLRKRTNKAFKSQNVEKFNKTFDLVQLSQSFFKRWFLHQLYGDMTEENYASVWTFDHCCPLSKTNLPDKNDRKDQFFGQI